MMKRKPIVEIRKYNLPREFPVLLLSGEKWYISDIPAEELHFHNCTEIGFCYSNSGVIETADYVHPFEKGDVTFISSDVAHTTYSTPGHLSKWGYLFVDLEELLFPYFSSVLSDPSIMEGWQKLSFNFFKIFSENENEDIVFLVPLMISVLEEKKANYQMLFRSLMLSFILKLIAENFSDKVSPKQKDIVKKTRIESSVHFIHKNYPDSNLSVEQLAQMLNLSLTHYRRLFNETMHTTPLSYITSVRIHAAMRRLSSTNDSILMISEAVGYQSISSFNRQFLKLNGLTPSEWRQNTTAIKDHQLVEYNGWLVPPDN